MDGNMLKIDMYRDGGTLIITHNTFKLLLDNRIGSPLRGKGLYLNTFGTPIPVDQVQHICDIVLTHLNTNTVDYAGFDPIHYKGVIMDFLSRIITNYQYVYCSNS